MVGTRGQRRRRPEEQRRDDGGSRDRLAAGDPAIKYGVREGRKLQVEKLHSGKRLWSQLRQPRGYCSAEWPGRGSCPLRGQGRGEARRPSTCGNLMN